MQDMTIEIIDNEDLYEDIEYLNSPETTPSNMSSIIPNITPIVTSGITPIKSNISPSKQVAGSSQKRKHETLNVPKKKTKSRYDFKVCIVLHPLFNSLFLIFLFLYLHRIHQTKMEIFIRQRYFMRQQM